jgi:transposase-like protein
VGGCVQDAAILIAYGINLEGRREVLGVYPINLKML